MSVAHSIGTGAANSRRPSSKAPEPAAPRGPGLTGRLRQRLGELEGKGYTILWISVPIDELPTLFIEGGEEAVLMDPDPARDTAWFGPHEIRPCANPGVWIYLEGEYDDISRHEV